MDSSAILSRTNTSSIHSFDHRDDSSDLAFLEAILIRNVLRDAMNMMRLITMETINSKTDAACLCLLLNNTEVNQSLFNKPFDFSTENVVSIMLSIESQWRILMAEVTMTQSFALFYDKMRKLSSVLEADQKNERCRRIFEEVQNLKPDQSFSETYFKMKMYANELHARLEVEDFQETIELRLAINQSAVAIENAADHAKDKERSYMKEIYHYDIEFTKENFFKLYLDTSADQIQMLEKDSEYWSKKYENDIESIENKIHKTRESIKSLQALLVYHQKEYKKLIEYQKKNEAAAKVVKQWHNIVSKLPHKRATSKKRKAGQKNIVNSKSSKKNKAGKIKNE